MISEKPELLKCPFCGKEPRYVPADYVDNHGQPWPFAECNPCNVGAPVEFWNKRTNNGRGEVVAWSYCPECGCEELHHEVGEHKQCANCHQEWFSDIDYSDVVRGNLQKLKAEQPAPVAVVMPPAQCRQRIAAEGKPYPRSSCAVCGQCSPKSRECDAMIEASSGKQK